MAAWHLGHCMGVVVSDMELAVSQSPSSFTKRTAPSEKPQAR
jgi:hypothetical protein